MDQRAPQTSAEHRSSDRSAEHGGRSEPGLNSSKKLTPLKQKDKKAPADVHGPQATLPRLTKAPAAVENPALTSLRTKAEVDAATLAHFQALAEQVAIHLSSDEGDQHTIHGDDSALTEPLDGAAQDGARPPADSISASRSKNTPEARKRLLKTFLSSLSATAAQSQIRFEQALRHQARMPAKPSRGLKPAFHAFNKGEHLTGPISTLFRNIRREEAHAIRSSVPLHAEAASQDSHPDHLRDDGYEEDDFVIDDDLATSSDTSQPDDDSTYVESDDEPARCSQDVKEQIFAAVDHFIGKLKPTPLDPALTIDRTPVTFRRSCSRFTQFALLFNAWLPQDFTTIPRSQLTLFLELIHSCHSDLGTLFKVFISRFLPHAKPLVRFMWCCIRETIDHHALSFKFAYEKLHRRSPPHSSTHNGRFSPSRQDRFCPRHHAHTHTPTPSDDDKLKKQAPTTKRPVLKDLDDIATFMSTFWVEYSKFKRDFVNAGYAHDSLFQCLSPTQQNTLATMSGSTADSFQLLSDDQVLEAARAIYGINSQAAAIHALKAVPFTGTCLERRSWSKFHQSFSETVMQIADKAMPLPKQIASIFVRSCPFPFMRTTLVAQDFQTLASALSGVQSLLRNPDFLSDAQRHSSSTRPERDRDRDRKPPTAHGPYRPDRRDRDAPRERPRFPIDAAANRNDAPPRHDVARAIPPLHSAPLPHSKHTCSRCAGDHPTNCCIRGKHSDGKDLPRLSKDDYLRNKANLEHFIKRQTIAAIRNADGDAAYYTSDEDRSASSDNAAASTTSDSDDALTAAAITQSSPIDSSSDSDLANNVDSGALAFHHFCACVEVEDNIFGIDGPVVPEDPSGEAFLSGDDEEPPEDKTTPPLPIHGSRSSALSVFFPPAVHAVLPHEAPPHTQAHINNIYPGAFDFPTVDNVPVPSLLMDGDVEPNPGPRRLRNVYWRPPAKSLSICHLAYILFAAAPTVPVAATFTPLNAVNIPLFRATFSTVWIHEPASMQPHFLIPSALLLTLMCCTTTLMWRCARAHNAFVPHVATTAHYASSGLHLFSSKFPPSSTPSIIHELNPLLLLCALALLLQRCGDVESNPGPGPTAHDAPSFSPPSNGDATLLANVHNALSAVVSQTTCKSSAVLPSIDTTTTDATCSDTVVAAVTSSKLLEPPFFVGFITGPDDVFDFPAPEAAVICALDSMCLGKSVISKELADARRLPRSACSISSRTAAGAKVRCTELAHFRVHIHVNRQWLRIVHHALVWEHTVEPLLLCNDFCLTHMFIYMCHPQPDRIKHFGDICFSLDWNAKLLAQNQTACAVYNEDVMSAEIEELTDLSAPLLWGQQDPKSVPPDGRHYARLYPSMLMPIPRDADPRLPLWRAHIDETQLALYSWPTCKLKELSEDRLPLHYHSPLSLEFEKLVSMHFAEPVVSFPPVGVVMRAQLVNKTKTEKRFTVNGSVQKKCMRVSAYPMPAISKIFDFVASFEFRAKIDLKHAYHNLEVHPDDRKYTITIGAGRAIQWRKCVQGFASTGNFFQWAMELILGAAVVFVIAAVYLDDLIIVGHTSAECAANFSTVMKILNDVNFRVAFAKCQFTPSQSISFLGCQLDGLKVSPGPKVALALGKILPFYKQPTPKTQQQHLYSFLGLCAYLNNHKLGLKPALQPLYDIVAKSPFTFSDCHRQCFDMCHAMLLELDPYWLPDPTLPLEIMTDASGGTTGDGLIPSAGHWAAVLGQRIRPIGTSAAPVFNENFRLLQIIGGAFSDRQAVWSILEKEYFAIYSAFVKFDYYIRGRPITLLTDSRVLLHAAHSINPKIQRWFSYVQGFDFDIHHITSEQNSLCDALTRCVSLATLLPTPSSGVLIPAGPQATRRPRRAHIAASIRPYPHISILLDGDVESNPGPRSNRQQVDFSSSSDDARPIIISDDDEPIVAPVPPVRRHRRSNPPQDQAPTPPARLSPTTPPLTQRRRQPPQPAIPASQLPASHLLPATFSLQIITLPVDHNVFFHALSQALSYDRQHNAHTPLTPDERLLCDPRNIREQIVSFMTEHSGSRFDIFQGVPLRDVVRNSYVLASPRPTLSLRGDRSTHVSSWREYLRHMILDAVADSIATQVAALLFNVQIVLVSPLRDHYIINPDIGLRRVFIFQEPAQCIGWLCPAELNHPDILPHSNTLSITPDPSALRFNCAPLADSEQSQPSSHVADKLSWLYQAHCGLTGHPGKDATLTILKANGHTWRGMTRDVNTFIRTCATCSVIRSHHSAALANAARLRVTDRPLSRWHSDHVTFTPCRHTRFTSICLFVDEVTAFSWLAGSKFKSALETASSLVQLSALFGVPTDFHTDAGPEYDNRVLEQFCAISGMKHSFGIPNNPNTRGIAEKNIALTTRILRSICTTFGRQDAWGLFIPLAMRAINSLPRSCLNGLSPSQFVFAGLHDPSSDVFATSTPPSGYNPFLRDLPTNIHSTFTERAIYSQEVIASAVCEYHDAQFASALAADNESPPESLSIGQHVLIDWTGHTRPPLKDKLLPIYRGPYVITNIHRNTLSLVHVQNPAPPHQPPMLQWSRAARVYPCELDVELSPLDPSAQTVPLSSSAFGIECILGHQLRNDLPAHATSRVEFFSQDVRWQLYEVRYHHSNSPNFVRQAFRYYDDIAHTIAMDNYVLGNPSLHSHVSVLAVHPSFKPGIPTNLYFPRQPPLADERDFQDIDPDPFSDSQ
jgi:hypothetical protein